MISLFPEKGRWFKGMLHVHSTESDGWISPARVLRAYKLRGYDFICLTDHWKVTPKPENAMKGILYIPGVELDGGRTDVGDFHFVGIDVKPKAVFKKQKAESEWTARELVKLIYSHGGIVLMAHPSWNGVSWVDLKDVASRLSALEVWNSGCDAEIGRGVSEVQWDDLLSRGHKIWGMAVDDTHRYYCDFDRGWVMVKASALTRPAIRAALPAGTRPGRRRQRAP